MSASQRQRNNMMGFGGNIAVLSGSGGQLLVDAGMIASRPQIKDSLASISPDPIGHLINALALRSHRRQRLAAPT